MKVTLCVLLLWQAAVKPASVKPAPGKTAAAAESSSEDSSSEDEAPPSKKLKAGSLLVLNKYIIQMCAGKELKLLRN